MLNLNQRIHKYSILHLKSCHHRNYFYLSSIKASSPSGRHRHGRQQRTQAQPWVSVSWQAG